MCGVGAGIVFQALGGDDPRIPGEEFDVLADPIEKLLHAVVDLTDFTAAAVQEVGFCGVAQVQHDKHRHQDNRKAGDGRERPCQLLFDIHDFSRGIF
ncbi:hypothetical protein D3C76_1244930 [compost metagenome]